MRMASAGSARAARARAAAGPPSVSAAWAPRGPAAAGAGTAKSILAAGAARAGEPEIDAGRPAPPRTGVPSNGVDEAPRRGTFAEASVGVFSTIGGSRRFSNAQPWLGLTVGRDLGRAASIFASLGV